MTTPTQSPEEIAARIAPCRASPRFPCGQVADEFWCWPCKMRLAITAAIREERERADASARNFHEEHVRHVETINKWGDVMRERDRLKESFEEFGKFSDEEQDEPWRITFLMYQKERERAEAAEKRIKELAEQHNFVLDQRAELEAKLAERDGEVLGLEHGIEDLKKLYDATIAKQRAALEAVRKITDEDLMAITNARIRDAITEALRDGEEKA